MSRANAIALCVGGIATAGVVLVAAVLLLHSSARPTLSAVAEPSGAASSHTDVTAAIVNINGAVAGGRIAGTGMVIESDGVVLTNNHVVAGTTDLTAQIAGTGPVYQATVIGVDPTHDVAVIRLDGASGMATAPLDTSGVLNLGDDVTGLGNALGADGAPVPASGKVTSLNDTLTVSDDDGQVLTTLNGLIQFSAPIQPGDSGGPLVNLARRVIGMDTAGSRSGTVAADGSVGAAIPITSALKIAHQILSGVPSAYIQSGHSGALGVGVAPGSADNGAQVGTVTTGEAAASAGIVTGDVITGVDGIPVQSAADLGAAMHGRRPGDRVTVTWRDLDGAAHQATVVLSPGPPA